MITLYPFIYKKENKDKEKFLELVIEENETLPKEEKYDENNYVIEIDIL